MPTRDELLDLIVNTTLGAIRSFASVQRRPKFQILDIIMPRERMIRSIVGGLETSMGTTLWEPLSKRIAELNGFHVRDAREIQKLKHVPALLETTVNNVISNREGQGSVYDADSSREEIKRACRPFIRSPMTEFENPPRGQGVDIWLEKDGINYLFDTKTVQPNVGAYKSYLTQLMHWYSYFYSKWPEAEARGCIVFPYNPHNGSFWEHTTNRGFPLLREEAKVENEYWDFLSGLENTYEIIRAAFEHIRDNNLIEQELNSLFYR